LQAFSSVGDQLGGTLYLVLNRTGHLPWLFQQRSDKSSNPARWFAPLRSGGSRKEMITVSEGVVGKLETGAKSWALAPLQEQIAQLTVM